MAVPLTYYKLCRILHSLLFLSYLLFS